MVSSACLPRALAKRKSDARLCPLKKQQQPRAETHPPYLPGYSWIQVAFELLDVRMGRVLHLESLLQETQQKQYEGLPQSAA